MRIMKNDYVMDWADNRSGEMKTLLKGGTLPYMADMEAAEKEESELDPIELMKRMPMLMGQVAGVIDEVMPAKDIMNAMMETAIASLKGNVARIIPEVATVKSRL